MMSLLFPQKGLEGMLSVYSVGGMIPFKLLGVTWDTESKQTPLFVLIDTGGGLES